MKIIHRKNKKGFTLIELLVVISIIGLLSSVVLSSLTVARKKSRDARRMDDLHQIAASLEQYHVDNNAYPITGSNGSGGAIFRGASTSGFDCFSNYDVTGSNGWVPDLAPEYISVLPLDPFSSQEDSCYLYGSADGYSYKLLAYLSVENDCSAPDGVPTGSVFKDPNPVRAGQCTYAVWSDGGESL